MYGRSPGVNGEVVLHGAHTRPTGTGRTSGSVDLREGRPTAIAGAALPAPADKRLVLAPRGRHSPAALQVRSDLIPAPAAVFRPVVSLPSVAIGRGGLLPAVAVAIRAGLPLGAELGL